MRVLCICGRTLHVGDDLIGKTVRCPSCNKKVKIESETEEMEAIEDSPGPARNPRHFDDGASLLQQQPAGNKASRAPFLFMVVGGMALLGAVATLVAVFWPRS